MSSIPTYFDLALKGGDQTYLPWNEYVPFAGIGGLAHEDHENEVRKLLRIVEDIMTIIIPAAVSGNASEVAFTPSSGETPVMGIFASTIANISREITCKQGESEDERTFKILKILSNYSWKAKVVLAIAAFAIKYGKLRLTTLLYEKNSLARSVALLKQQHDVPKLPNYMESWSKSLAKLLRAMVDLTRSIVKFKEDQPKKADRGDPLQQAMRKPDARIPTAVYWTIYSVVVCSTQVTAVLLMRYKNLAPYEWNLDDLTRTLTAQQNALTVKSIRPSRQMTIQPQLSCLKQLCMLVTPPVEFDRHAMSYRKTYSQPESYTIASSSLDERIYIEEYNKIVHLFNSSHIDNMDVLKALFADVQEELLLDGSTKERVSLDVLRSKTLLLYISNLDICHGEIQKFDKIYNESRQHHTTPECKYEVVWLPMVDRSMTWKEKSHLFQTVQSWMPWYSVYYPSLINPAAKKYITEVWQFDGKPQVVVLDPQGRVANRNSLHMIRIWGSMAFPFTRTSEEMLWKAETWRIEFLVDSFDQKLNDWIAEGKHICLYGGRDMEWIRRFTSLAKEIANTANIVLEMLYVEKNFSEDVVEGNKKAIVAENLSHVIEDQNSINVFWIRLESMLHSRAQTSDSKQNDAIMKEIKTMLEFNSDNKGWALIGKGGLAGIAKANGETILKSFAQFNQWKDDIADTGFVAALDNHLYKLNNLPECDHQPLPGMSPGTPSRRTATFGWRNILCFADPKTK